MTLGAAALLTLLPAALLPARRTGAVAGAHGWLFWLLLTAATVGPLAFEFSAQSTGWRTGFSATLWTIVASTMLIYLVVCMLSATARDLRPVLLPYQVGLAVLALVWSAVPGPQISAMAMTAWLQMHIAVSLATYALITLSASAAVAVWLKERSLRRRNPAGWTDALPSVAEGERLQNRLLLAAEVILGAGLLTGIATRFYIGGDILDHKTVLSFAAFAVIAGLLLVQRGSGLRGRRAARIVLAAYLLITLAFPGVKFVTDVILSQPI